MRRLLPCHIPSQTVTVNEFKRISVSRFRLRGFICWGGGIQKGIGGGGSRVLICRGRSGILKGSDQGRLNEDSCTRCYILLFLRLQDFCLSGEDVSDSVDGSGLVCDLQVEIRQL